MKIAPKHIAAIIFCLLLSVPVKSQVSVKSNISRDSILIGEPITVTIEAYVPVGSAVTWFRSDSIPGFEMLSASPIDTIQNIDAKKFTQTFSVTSFDSGQQAIPPFNITVDDQPYFTDSLTINVSFTPFDPKADYRDIKDIIETRNPYIKYVPWLLIILALIATMALVLAGSRRKFASPGRKKVDTIILTPYEEAMKALEELRKRQVTNGEVKFFYSHMNDILRNFVSRKFSISTFERTNEELIMDLSQMGIPKDSFISLAQSLRMSDFVKFAKYRPNDEENMKNLHIVSSSIEILDKTYTGAV